MNEYVQFSAKQKMKQLQKRVLNWAYPVISWTFR